MTTRDHIHVTMISLLVASIAGLLASNPAIADAVAQTGVRTAVQTWVRHVTADAKPEAVVARLEPHYADGEIVAYIAHLAGEGYCICGADNRLLPVYLYSPVGTYDPTNPGYQFILSDIARRLELHNAAQGQFTRTAPETASILTQRADDWSRLANGQLPAAADFQQTSGTPTIMRLPVNSYWKQGSPFNDYCPELRVGTDQRAVTGCVATTAAQIMYYWRWPASGTGSNSVEYNRRWRSDWDYEALTTDPQLNLDSFWDTRLYWTSFWGGRLYMSGDWDGSLYWSGARKACNNGVDCNDPDYLAALATLWDRMPKDPEICYANFATASYDYDLMQDAHSDPPDAGSLESAKLSYHAGIAVGMQYGIWASSAGMIRNGIVSHFRFDPDAVSAVLGESDILEDIQWYRPIEIAGSSEVGGHSWIIAGYNTAPNPNQYLMNMGWGGGTTVWNSVDQVFPNNQWTTTRLAPLGVVQFVGGSSGGDGSPSAPHEDLASALTSVPDNTTLVFKAGSTHTVTGTITKPVTLKGYDVTLTVP